MKLLLSTLSLLVVAEVELVTSFNVIAPTTFRAISSSRELNNGKTTSVLHMAGGDADDDAIVDAEIVNMKFETEEEKKEAVGNLVQDDEWNGLGMELSETIRIAVVEDLKKNARDFLGKDDYKVGDVTKEIDTRVKDEIAKMRGKENYELGDFTVAMDEMAKSMTEDLTGKPYETGDLSRVIDANVKESVAKFCGKDTYEFGVSLGAVDFSQLKKRHVSFCCCWVYA